MKRSPDWRALFWFCGIIVVIEDPGAENLYAGTCAGHIG
jgi:hypothetical protein